MWALSRVLWTLGRVQDGSMMCVRKLQEVCVRVLSVKRADLGV